ncbi:MAG: Flp pilus assembly protein CpaB [Victivallaceae bacterium]|nr:Flp pilus assembly protein CpaB [Victivallaceae bacterium]
MKQKMLLLGAVFFGFLAFVLTYTQIDSERKRILGEAESVYLIRLARHMAEGEEIKSTDIERAEVRRLRDRTGSAREIAWSRHSEVIGRRVESSMTKGQFLLITDLQPLTRRQGFTGTVRNGYRAVSIPVDPVSAVGNLVRPNDNVDVVGTFRFPDLRGDTALDTVTMTILQNVRVLAVGGRWGAYSSAAADSGDGSVRTSYSTVTLMLLPHEVEMVVFAAQKGRLSLSLRNFEETRIVTDTRSVNFRTLEKEVPKYNQFREKLQRGR